ncbi:MAG: UPF0175 family protein [Campylobacterales bacterium]|nr:UPF0175 family protein [Campylobacterales bacterium]
MESIGIKDLQVNPAKLTKAIERDDYVMITKRSKPIGVAVGLSDSILSKGLQTTLLINAFEDGGLSLGQLATALQISKKEAMNTLSLMGIDVVDYDFKDDLKSLDSF